MSRRSKRLISAGVSIVSFLSTSLWRRDTDMLPGFPVGIQVPPELPMAPAVAAGWFSALQQPFLAG